VHINSIYKHATRLEREKLMISSQVCQRAEKIAFSQPEQKDDLRFARRQTALAVRQFSESSSVKNVRSQHHRQLITPTLQT